MILCAACERRVRRGTGRRALILMHDGRTQNGTICRRCQIRATLFVTMAPVTVAPACSECKKAPAKICIKCVERVGEHARNLTAANVALRQTSKR